QSEGEPAAARGLIGTARAEVLAHQSHRRGAERRPREEAERFPAQGDAVGARGLVAELIDKAHEPELADHDRETGDAGRHTDAQEATQEVEANTEEMRMEIQPGAAARQDAQDRQAAQGVAQGGADGDTDKAKLGEGSQAPAKTPGQG